MARFLDVHQNNTIRANAANAQTEKLDDFLAANGGFWEVGPRHREADSAVARAIACAGYPASAASGRFVRLAATQERSLDDLSEPEADVSITTKRMISRLLVK